MKDVIGLLWFYHLFYFTCSWLQAHIQIWLHPFDNQWIYVIFFILNKQFQPQMWFRTDHKISWTPFTPVCDMNT